MCLCDTYLYGRVHEARIAEVTEAAQPWGGRSARAVGIIVVVTVAAAACSGSVVVCAPTTGNENEMIGRFRPRFCTVRLYWAGTT